VTLVNRWIQRFWQWGFVGIVGTKNWDQRGSLDRDGQGKFSIAGGWWGARTMGNVRILETILGECEVELEERTLKGDEDLRY